MESTGKRYLVPGRVFHCCRTGGTGGNEAETAFFIAVGVLAITTSVTRKSIVYAVDWKGIEFLGMNWLKKSDRETVSLPVSSTSILIYIVISTALRK